MKRSKVTKWGSAKALSKEFSDTHASIGPVQMHTWIYETYIRVSSDTSTLYVCGLLIASMAFRRINLSYYIICSTLSDFVPLLSPSLKIGFMFRFFNGLIELKTDLVACHRDLLWLQQQFPCREGERFKNWPVTRGRVVKYYYILLCSLQEVCSKVVNFEEN